MGRKKGIKRKCSRIVTVTKRGKGGGILRKRNIKEEKMVNQ